MANEENCYIFEASWEVCNKVGGIYTVLSTKAKTLQKLHKDHVIFIGPDLWTDENPSLYFEESKTVLKKWVDSALLPEGVDVRVGRWDIPGRPIAILVKYNGMYATKDQFYGQMWQKYGVDSLHAYGDYDESVAFGRAAAAVIESLVDYLKTKEKGPVEFIAHFDEWTLGAGLLTIKDERPDIATVFTTHATSIGRSICGNGKPLYDHLKNYNGDQMAEELNMQSKHTLEKAAAHAADAFTTVSEVTAKECTQLLERTPDVVTPNGFEAGFVPTKAKFAAARAAARAKMLQVGRALTGVDFKDEDTFIVATSGRNEYRNKGIDVYCDVLARLAETGTPKPVLAFIMVPAWAGDPRTDLVASITENETNRLADPVITHALHNYNDDAINNRIHQLGFAGNDHVSVTVIYVPCYLNGHDGIFDMSYYDLLIGMDATVFPSYYEPWGYTPLESVAFGVPTITTSLSGFGQWVRDTTENTFADCGVVAVERGDSNYWDVVREIADQLQKLMGDDAKTLAKISKAAMATAARADWSNFIKYYVEAYNIALGKVKKSKSKTKKKTTN